VRVFEVFIIVMGFTVGPIWLLRAQAVRDYLVASSEAIPTDKSRLARVSPVAAASLKRAALGWARKGWYVKLIRMNGAILMLGGLIFLGRFLVRIFS
jgi:hypothetical protein